MNVSVTGVAATGGAGSFVGAVKPAPSGVAATGSAGSFASSVQLTLVGLVAGSAIGIPGIGSQNANVNVTGIVATAAVGAPVIAGDSQPTFLGLQLSATVGFPQGFVTPNLTNIPITGLFSTAHIGVPTRETLIPLVGLPIHASIAPPVGLMLRRTPHRMGLTETVGLAVVTFADGMFLTDLSVTTIPQPVSDVALNVRWSDTDGYSWSDSVQRTMGETGQYLTSIQVRRLGMSRRGRVFELSWDSPGPTALMGVSVTYEDSGT